MNEMRTYELFPTPLYACELGRDLTNEEYQFMTQQRWRSESNIGNRIGDDEFILNHDELADIKSEITKAINVYSEKVARHQSDMKLYITQSWLNWTTAGEYHHPHCHFNSLLSGILYIDVDETVDTITFHRRMYDQLMPHQEDYNQFNAPNFTLKVRKGLFLLFPSDLTHEVKVKTGDNVRLSLAFNTFFTGAIGIGKAKLTL